jgi:transposase
VCENADNKLDGNRGSQLLSRVLRRRLPDGVPYREPRAAPYDIAAAAADSDHREGIGDRVVFDKLIQVLVLGAAYERIADSTCSATTIRRRRNEWIHAGVFERLEQLCLEAHDRIVGLELEDVTVDGCIVKAPCGGEARWKVAGRPRQTRHQTLTADRSRRDPAGLRGRPREPP